VTETDIKFVKGKHVKIVTMLSNGRGASAGRRQARQTRRQLERELSTYRTPAERLELDAILERHSVEETWEVRQVLARQARTADADR
jgi:hypothetical protein